MSAVSGSYRLRVWLLIATIIVLRDISKFNGWTQDYAEIEQDFL